MFLNVLFCNRILSYFAKPNFIIYDEWFDDNLKKTKLDVKNKKIKTISNMHDFFYEQSNYKVGASENNLQIEIKVNKKELSYKNYLKNTSDKNIRLSIKKFRLFEKLTNSKLNLTKKLVYSLSIFSFIFIFGFLFFFISQSKNESNIINKPMILEKGF
jgi:hypothetical protein